MNKPVDKGLRAGLGVAAPRDVAAAMNSIPEKFQDASVVARIQNLAAEEHALFERESLEQAESKRLAAIETELDQCWDLLRQRRALREYGRDAAGARVRDPEVVKKYSG